MSDTTGLLIPTFPGQYIRAAQTHFANAVNDFGQSDWEGSITKTGKFVEAILKAIASHCGIQFEGGRQFKVDKVINALGQLPVGTYDDSLRLLIPRSCRVIYDIASNRGARHDSEEIDPNSMDANVVMSMSGWILAEMIRFAQKGAVDPSGAKELVEALIEKKFPVVEEVDGRIYLHKSKKSAVDVALVVLAKKHPRRLAVKDLINIVERNGFTQKNAQLAVQRIGKFTDVDDQGQLRLLGPGLRRAEEIIGLALSTT